MDVVLKILVLISMEPRVTGSASDQAVRVLESSIVMRLSTQESVEDDMRKIDSLVLVEYTKMASFHPHLPPCTPDGGSPCMAP